MIFLTATTPQNSMTNRYDTNKKRDQRLNPLSENNNMVCSNSLSFYKYLLASVIACMLLLAPFTVDATEQRIIINQSFEDGPVLPTTFVVTPDSNVHGWESTNDTNSTEDIELWRDGFLQMMANDGDYFIELNPRVPIGLYQEVCLVNGEQLSWSFAHAARTGGDNPQTVVYEIDDINGNLIQTLATSVRVPIGSSTINNSGNNWQINPGTTVYTGPTGTQRLQFRSIAPPGSTSPAVGNFLDSISIKLLPVIYWSAANTISSEIDGSNNAPQFTVEGTVETEFTVDVEITGGTATQGVDYSATTITPITIPVGTYDGITNSTFTIPLNVLTDTINEPDETIEFTIAPVTTPANVGYFIDQNCTVAHMPLELTHTITDHAPVDLSMTKTVNDTNPDIGDQVTFTLVIENSGPNPAVNVTVNDIVPAGFTYLSGTMTGGDSRDESTPTTGSGLEWIINNLAASPAAGSSASLSFDASVNPP